MNQNVLTRNNVKVTGSGKQAVLFAPGFGCDQTVWNSISKSFEEDYQVILFDYVGLGLSDVKAYDSEKYSKLSGYVQDLLDVCSALNLTDIILVGHSVGATIGMLASLRKPEYFSQLIMIGPSACYLNDPPKYIGGFEEEDLLGLIDLMAKNYIGWANVFSATALNNPDRPDIEKDIEDRFCSTDPVIARDFAEACFFADNRHDLSKVTVPSLILQCANDVIAPVSAGEFMHNSLPNSTIKYMNAIGHFPHMSHPEETKQLIREYLLKTSNSLEKRGCRWTYVMDAQLNQAPCGFLTLTKDGTIVSVNETLLQVLDYTSDELVDQHINSILTKSTRIFFHLYFMQLVTVQHRVEEMYLSLKSKNEEDTPVLINAVLNEQQVISCIIVPIRKRSEYENQLLIAKKVAEDALKEKEKTHQELETALQHLEANQQELLEINKQNQKYNLDTYQELQLAKKIQERSLTKPICNDSIHIESYYKASSGLSGDIYGFYKVNDHQYGIILLDVMGHGISSALITMSLQSLFQRLISTGVSANMVMQELDNHLHTLFPSDESVWHYCTAIYLFIDTANHTIEYLNAGHPPLIYQDSNGEQLELYASSPPLGTFDDIHYKTKTFSYKKGARIFLYTDGVSESLEPEPINSLLSQHSALSLTQFKEQIMHSLNKKNNTAHKKDDQCFILVDLK